MVYYQEENEGHQTQKQRADIKQEGIWARGIKAVIKGFPTKF